MVYNDITDLIGNTPLLEINPTVHGLRNVNIYAKLEMMNPFGSVKDRTALGMLKGHMVEIESGGKTVIEASSGNTAKALSLLCSIRGITFQTVTNRIKTNETRDILSVIGAEVDELPGTAECYDPNDPNDPVLQIERRIIKNPNKYFHTSQYTNADNFKIHEQTTGREIAEDLSGEGGVDYFFAALGTTGSSRGVINRLKLDNPDLKAIGIIAEKGHSIPGIRNQDEMLEVGIFDSSLYDDIISVDSIEAVDSMLGLIRKSGVLGGPTSGACYGGMLEYLRSIDESLDHKVNAVFVVCDRFEWYMSYIKKRRPELFGSLNTNESVLSMSDDQLHNAKLIKANEATDWIEHNDPLIIDLRGNLAYRSGHIRESINIVDSIFEQIIEGATPFDPGKKVLFVCSTGYKSDRFSAFLNRKGLNTYSLSGGVVAWREAEIPLERARV